MKLNYSFILIILIFTLSFALRFIQLGNTPAILNRDEAALGYNAYLLSETGKDEWGITFPLFLKSFGDFKLIGYPALLIPLIKMFGMQDWVVRTPSVIAGTLMVFVSYLFMRNLLFSQKTSLMLALVVAIQPVFIFYSRIAFEANLALLYLLTGLWLLSKNSKKADLLSIFSISLACITYNTPLILLPFIIVIVVLYRGLKKPKTWILPVMGLLFVGFVLLTNLLPVTSQKGNITVFNDETTWMEWINYRSQLSGLSLQTIGNKYVYLSGKIFNNYIQSFSPKFLVLSGGTHPWHSLPNWGHILSVVYIFFWVGLISFFYKLFIELSLLIHTKQLKKVIIKFKSYLLLFSLLSISLLPSIITVDAPHATRSLLFFFLICCWAVIGLESITDLLKSLFDNTKIIKYFLVLSLSLILINSGLYLNDYFSWTLVNQSSWKPGIDEILSHNYLELNENRMVVIDQDGYNYILVAWYLQMDSNEFLRSIVRQQQNSFGFYYGQQVGNFHFLASPEDRNNLEKSYIYWENRTNSWQLHTET